MNNPLFSIIICLSKKSPAFEYYESVIMQFVDNFGYHVQIDGSPFEYAEIEKILDLLKRIGIKEVGIRTNEKIDLNILNLIKKYNIRSLMFRNQNKILDENIKIVGNTIPIEVSVILQRDNVNELDNIISNYSKKNISLLVLERSIIAKYRNEKFRPLEPKDYKNVMEKILNYNHSNNRMGIALSHCPNKILLHKNEKYINNLGGCSAGIVSCAIDENGDVIPCLPLYTVVVGNIKNNSLMDIWNNSEIFKNLRDRAKLQGKCGKCEYVFSCGGCRAESFYNNNNLFGEDNTCWKE